MKKFLNETKELLLSQGLIAVLAIIQVRVVATNLGPEAYGNIGVYLGLVGLSFRILSSRNSDLVLINFKSTNKNFLNSAIYFEILLGIVSLIFVYGIFFVYYNFIFNYLILYFVTRVFLNIQEVFKGVFTHNGDMKTYSLVESSSNITRFILVVTFVSLNPDISSFFYALTFHQLFVSVLVLLLLLKKDTNKAEKITFKEYIKMSKSNFYKIRTDQSVGLIPTHLDVVVIGYFADYYSAGIYRIAKKLVDPINSLIVAFSPWMLNKINNQGDYNFRNLFINILLPSSVIIFSFYYLFGSNLIEIIAGDEFADAFIPMMILLFGFMSYYLTFWTRHFLFMNDLIHKHTIGRVINLIIFLSTAPFFISNFGFNGIAISISLSTAFQKLYEFSVYLKYKNNKNNY
ncbi:oligosaccharide flippase family protein [Acidimicrobiaceae bacterium]|nr:oligosaccharide flippase family protein [Acidimicrobiaceae bacterium]